MSHQADQFPQLPLDRCGLCQIDWADLLAFTGTPVCPLSAPGDDLESRDLRRQGCIVAAVTRANEGSTR